MKSLYTEKEKRILDLKERKAYWRKQQKNKKSIYSDFYIRQMIEKIEEEIKLEKGGRMV